MRGSKIDEAPKSMAPVLISDAATIRTMPIMTKYEFSSVVGLRTMHLAKGAQPFVDVPEGLRIRSNMELRKIAIRELLDRRLPYIIKRPFPNGTVEYVRVSDLDLCAVHHLMRIE